MINSIGLIINYRKKQPVQLAQEIVQWFVKKGIMVYAPENDGTVLGLKPDYIIPELGQEVDCVLTLGGDGTFLRAARLMAPYGVPVLGINMGTLGFLTEIEVSEIEVALQKLIRGQYYLEDRLMLEAKVLRNNKIIYSSAGLNDVVVTKGPLARINTLDVHVDQQYYTTYKADGVIVSSPTGSTAYSLSAGGPIVYPEVEVIILTPICPHSLHARPLVIPGSKTVRINISYQQSESMLTIDGQNCFDLLNGDEIIVSKAPYQVRLVRIKEHNFFSIMREKLKAEGSRSYE